MQVGVLFVQSIFWYDWMLSVYRQKENPQLCNCSPKVMGDTTPAVSSIIKEEAEACPIDHDYEDCEIKRSLNIITVMVETSPAAPANIKHKAEDCSMEHDDEDCEIQRSLNIITVMADMKPTILPSIKEERGDCSVGGQDSEMKGSISNSLVSHLETGKLNKKESYTCSECKLWDKDLSSEDKDVSRGDKDGSDGIKMAAMG
ncbi:hypothetical protein NDU88_007803 [Pleurodeles waltl]|uniref:Uncharacterized protein n=1 Tax=Pleurodeles waltl TaxID=8319 RepID=A0AAV7STU1_PLEWA|nr:hypothetical protein NDU88_007803 [Pleurodeles waltl]